LATGFAKLLEYPPLRPGCSPLLPPICVDSRRKFTIATTSKISLLYDCVRRMAVSRGLPWRQYRTCYHWYHFYIQIAVVEMVGTITPNKLLARKQNVPICVLLAYMLFVKEEV
jgi:hypothetical protein